METLRFDAQVHPTCADFVSRLPHGLDSYSECTMAVHFLNLLHRDFPSVLQAATLPPLLRRRLKGPWPENAWVSTTTMVVSHLIVHDAGFNSTTAFEARIFDLSCEMYASNVFRPLMHLLSPSLLLLGAANRWSHFYRGDCTLSAQQAGKQAAELRVSFPPHLFPPIYLTALGASLRAAAAATGAKATTAKVVESGDTQALLRIEWA